MTTPNLYRWTSEASAALELTGDAAWAGTDETVGIILDLARDVAHGVARPAAPVAAFLAGMAAARGGGTPAELAAACSRIRATIPNEEAVENA
jgi:hypothetical protein